MNAKSFWNRTKALIKNKKVTQEISAKTCGIPINTWRGWGSKNIVPGVEDCIKIARFLNVSLDFLILGKENNLPVKIEEIQDLLERAKNKINTLK